MTATKSVTVLKAENDCWLEGQWSKYCSSLFNLLACLLDLPRPDSA
jgi:hypothetical protein